MLRLLFELNRRVPNGMHGGVRGRRDSALLDFINPLISKGLEVFCFQERVVDWLHFERKRVLRGKLSNFSWLIIVNTVIDCQY